MRRIVDRLRVAGALAAALAWSGHAPAQTPPPRTVVVVPPAGPAAAPGLRGLGREFLDNLRYPFYAVPESFRPGPGRVALRPGFDGAVGVVPAPAQPVKPLFISGYAGARPPAPRRVLVPATGAGGRRGPLDIHGPLGAGPHHRGIR